jgi:hypothetical protein
MGDTRIDDFNRWAARDGWSTRVDGALAFELPMLQDCLAAWTKAAAGKALPLRADMTPRRMKSFLTNVVILDVVRDGAKTRFRVRVIGSETQRVLGGKAGDFLDDRVEEPFGTRWQKLLKVVLELKAPVRCYGTVDFHNQTYLDAEGFVAPLAGDDGGEPVAVVFVQFVAPKSARRGKGAHHAGSFASGP